MNLREVERRYARAIRVDKGDGSLLRFYAESAEDVPELVAEIRRLRTALASRPAPVAPPTEEWEDPERWVDLSTGNRHSVIPSPILAIVGKWEHKPRTREQYEADQQPVVPVDALGFPTQEGATFRARYANDWQNRYPTYRFEVIRGPQHFRNLETGRSCDRLHLDPASIEDVRPADGRGAQ